jgi:hypothetical protein
VRTEVRAVSLRQPDTRAMCRSNSSSSWQVLHDDTWPAKRSAWFPLQRSQSSCKQLCGQIAPA